MNTNRYLHLSLLTILVVIVVFQSVGHEVATYEDVIKLMPDYSRRRPIVLIGMMYIEWMEPKVGVVCL